MNVVEVVIVLLVLVGVCLGVRRIVQESTGKRSCCGGENCSCHKQK